MVQKQSNNVISCVNGDTEAAIVNYVSVLNRDDLSQATIVTEAWSLRLGVIWHALDILCVLTVPEGELKII
jgi:hypothetical protein